MESNIYSRLGAAMAEMPNPVKDTKAYNYKYETLDQVLGIIQPALMSHGLFAQQGIDGEEGEYCLSTAVCDTEGGERLTLDRRPVVFTGDPQKDGSSETYARRYALKTVFGLCGEDDDGAAASKTAQSRARQQAHAKKQTKAAEAATEPCSEWHAMVQAVQDYVEITGKPKREVWARWGQGVAKDDAEMCLAIKADIDRALNE